VSDERAFGLGPVGLVGVAALLLGFLRRSFLLALVGGAALAADVLMPELGGYAARTSSRDADQS
jgi:hypothetical protein